MHLVGHQLLESADLSMVAVEEGQETGLGSRGSLDSSKPELGLTAFEFGQVENQVVAPQTGPFADGGELCRLEVSEPQGFQVTPAFRKASQGVNGADQTIAQEFQSFAHEQQIGVVGHVAAGRPQVDDVAGSRADVAIGVDVGHDIVAKTAFVLLGFGKVDVVDVGAFPPAGPE